MLIRERVDRVLRDQLGDGFEWDARTSLTASPGLALDSLDIVELIMGLEEEFAVDIPDDLLWGARSGALEDRTVGELTDYLDRRLAARPAMAFG